MYLARLHRYNAKLNNVVTFLDDVGAGAGEAGGRRDRGGQIQRAAARHSVGREGHHLGQGLQDDVGHGAAEGSGARLRRERRRDAARGRRGADCEADHRRAGVGRQLVRRADQEPVGSRGGVQRLVGRPFVGHGRGLRGVRASAPRPADRSSVRRRGAAWPACGRRSAASAATACMALSWTQDRLGPICRYAEDCAIVMQAIAKPDGRDMSVSDAPFNWDARLDIKKLRVGYIKESFDTLANADGEAERAEGARHAEGRLASPTFIPMTIPVFNTNVRALGIESAAYFDHMTRAGKMTGARGGSRNERVADAGGGIPAAAARAHDDDDEARGSHAGSRRLSGRVEQHRRHGRRRPGRGRGAAGDPADPAAAAAAALVAPAKPGAVAEAGRGARTPAEAEVAAAGAAARRRNPAQRHSTMANLACYPGDQHAERIRRERPADQRHVLRASVRRDRDCSRSRRPIRTRRASTSRSLRRWTKAASP